MKFHIQGASKETGDEVEFDIIAMDSKSAELIARDRGVMVSAITAKPDEINLDSIEMEPELNAPDVLPNSDPLP